MFRLQSVLSGSQRKSLRHPKEIPLLILAVIVTVLTAAIVLGVLAAAEAGLVSIDDTTMQLVALAIAAPILILVMRGYLYAQQRTSGVRITPTQFPDAYRMIAEAALDAGLRRMPDAYVTAGSGVLNAFASGHGHRRFVVLHSDLFELGGERRDPAALRFVIGHEVGHLAAGHVAYWRLLFTFTFSNLPVLSSLLTRAQEYTADNYGYRFSPDGAPGGISALAAGKYLNKEVHPDEYADRAVTEKGIFIWAANLLSSHPVLTWRSHALRDRSRPGRLLFRPRAGVARPASLPPGSSRTADWSDPAQAVALMRSIPAGQNAFGGVQVEQRPTASYAGQFDSAGRLVTSPEHTEKS